MTRAKLEVAVLAIVLAIFASLISVAILEARTAARKMSSRNNLKQIGLGIENHESVHKRLPSGCDEGAMHGWMSTILPLIEASTWYKHSRL